MFCHQCWTLPLWFSSASFIILSRRMLKRVGWEETALSDSECAFEPVSYTTIKVDCNGGLVVEFLNDLDQVAINVIKPHSDQRALCHALSNFLLKSIKTCERSCWCWRYHTVSLNLRSVLLCCVLVWSLLVLLQWLFLPCASACLIAPSAWLYLGGQSGWLYDSSVERVMIRDWVHGIVHSSVCYWRFYVRRWSRHFLLPRPSPSGILSKPRDFPFSSDFAAASLSSRTIG